MGSILRRSGRERCKLAVLARLHLFPTSCRKITGNETNYSKTNILRKVAGFYKDVQKRIAKEIKKHLENVSYDIGSRVSRIVDEDNRSFNEKECKNTGNFDVDIILFGAFGLR